MIGSSGSFLLGPGIFSGATTVSFRECNGMRFESLIQTDDSKMILKLKMWGVNTLMRDDVMN